jgi:hypothetical protein
MVSFYTQYQNGALGQRTLPLSEVLMEAAEGAEGHQINI